MKKSTFVLFTIIILLSFISCNGKKNDNPLPESMEISVADIIKFGGINWLVLEKTDDTVLIISEQILENGRQYHLEYENITWEQCDLRKYLNGEFYNKTFSAAEKNLIIETTVKNNDNPEYGTSGGEDTTDNIFSLNIAEAKQYFSDDSSRVAYNEFYAIDNWWLRSPGVLGSSTVFIRFDGSIDIFGGSVYRSIGVRPALWLNIQS